MAGLKKDGSWEKLLGCGCQSHGKLEGGKTWTSFQSVSAFGDQAGVEAWLATLGSCSELSLAEGRETTTLFLSVQAWQTLPPGGPRKPRPHVLRGAINPHHLLALEGHLWSEERIQKALGPDKDHREARCSSAGWAAQAEAWASLSSITQVSQQAP